jgi:hypothetical protein
MPKARSPAEKRAEAQKAHGIRKRKLLGPTHPKFPSESERRWLDKYNARVEPSNRGRPLEGLPPGGAPEKPVPPGQVLPELLAPEKPAPPGQVLPELAPEKPAAAPEPAPEKPPPEPPPPPEKPAPPALPAAGESRCSECGRVLQAGETCTHEAPPPVDVPHLGTVKVPAQPNAPEHEKKKGADPSEKFNAFDMKGGFSKFLVALVHKLVDRAADLDPDVKEFRPHAHEIVDDWYKPAAQITEQWAAEEARKRLKVNPRQAAALITVTVPIGLGFAVSEMEKQARKQAAEAEGLPSNGRPAPGWSQPKPEARGPAVAPPPAPPAPPAAAAPPPPAPAAAPANGAPRRETPPEREPGDVSDRYVGSGG